MGGSTARFINDPTAAAAAVASAGRNRGVHNIIICLPAAQAHQIPLRPDAAARTSEGYYIVV